MSDYNKKLKQETIDRLITRGCDHNDAALLKKVQAHPDVHPLTAERIGFELHSINLTRKWVAAARRGE